MENREIGKKGYSTRSSGKKPRKLKIEGGESGIQKLGWGKPSKEKGFLKGTEKAHFYGRSTAKETHKRLSKKKDGGTKP